MTISNGYVTLAEAQVLLGITEATHVADLERAIETASRWIDHWTGRRFYPDATAAARYFTPDSPTDLPVFDISTVTGLVVKTDDNDDGTYENTWTLNSKTVSQGFTLEPFNASTLGIPWTRLTSYSGLWPVGIRKGVEVTAKWGWAACPIDIVQACLLLAARLYTRKDAPFGMVGTRETGFLTLPPLDSDVKNLLASYRRLETVDA